MSQLDLRVGGRHLRSTLELLETGRSRPSARCCCIFGESSTSHCRAHPCCSPRATPEPYQATDFDAPGDAVGTPKVLERLLAAHRAFRPYSSTGRCRAGQRQPGRVVLVEGVDPDLVQPCATVLRASLHPRGLAPRIVNIGHGVRTSSRTAPADAVNGRRRIWRELERELWVRGRSGYVPRRSKCRVRSRMPMRCYRRWRARADDDDRHVRDRPRHHPGRVTLETFLPADPGDGCGPVRPLKTAPYRAYFPIPDASSPVRFPFCGGG